MLRFPFRAAVRPRRLRRAKVRMPTAAQLDVVAVKYSPRKGPASSRRASVFSPEPAPYRWHLTRPAYKESQTGSVEPGREAGAAETAASSTRQCKHLGLLRLSMSAGSTSRHFALILMI